jgi:imidazolonepropionase-like amidohydrolase
MTRTIGATLAICGALAVVIALAAHTLRAQTNALVIEGATLLDGNGGAPIENSVIVVQGSRIEAIGTKGAVRYPRDATIIDAAGRTVLPGLIDAHIHSLDFFPPLFLHFGVTTVYDTANPTEWIIAQREALKQGRIRGPRMFVTGVVIDGPDSTADRRDAYRMHVRTPEEARTLARSLLRRGVDALKVYQHLTPELLKPIVDEAHRDGTEAVGHSRDAKEAIGAGLKFIEHATPIAHATLSDSSKIRAMDAGALDHPEADMDSTLFDPLIALMLRQGVYFNPTLTREWIAVLPKRTAWYAEAAALLDEPAYQFIPAARRKFWLGIARAPQQEAEPRASDAARQVQEFTRRYAQAGGRIITGPDSGPSSGPANMAGLAMHVEMEALVDAGLTPMQAIQASTKWPAELLHKEKDLGTIAPGKIADLIVIDGNPLVDIRATRLIRTVIKDGKVVDTRLDPTFRNPIPRPVAEYEVDRQQ